MAREIDVATPFDFCQKCEKFKLDSREIFGDGVVWHTVYSCEHEDICGYVVPLSRDNQWTPMSDGEPKGHVIATIKWGNDDYEVTEIDYGVEKACGSEIADKVIAWIPMPKRYKGAGNG